MPIPIPQPLPTINPLATQSSSLAQVAYDPRRSILQVEFRDGATYQYADVPVETYHDLLQADSKGAYFNRCVRNIFRHALVRAAPVASKHS
jgi:hypothetical protein